MNQRGWKSILAGLVLALLVLSAAPVAQISPQDEVRQINEEIELLGLDWVADVTPLTLMTPAERRREDQEESGNPAVRSRRRQIAIERVAARSEAGQ